jgi:hypothetical protein
MTPISLPTQLEQTQTCGANEARVRRARQAYKDKFRREGNTACMRRCLMKHFGFHEAEADEFRECLRRWVYNGYLVCVSPERRTRPWACAYTLSTDTGSHCTAHLCPNSFDPAHPCSKVLVQTVIHESIHCCYYHKDDEHIYGAAQCIATKC